MFYSIIRIASSGEVTKYHTFPSREEAEAHNAKFNGIAVFETETDKVEALLVSEEGVVTERAVPEFRIPETKLRARALRAIENKLLEEEMQKENPLPEVAALKAHRGK